MEEILQIKGHTGVESLKIEGRMKTTHYVATVVGTAPHPQQKLRVHVVQPVKPYDMMRKGC